MCLTVKYWEYAVWPFNPNTQYLSSLSSASTLPSLSSLMSADEFDLLGGNNFLLKVFNRKWMSYCSKRKKMDFLYNTCKIYQRMEVLLFRYFTSKYAMYSSILSNKYPPIWKHIHCFCYPRLVLTHRNKCRPYNVILNFLVTLLKKYVKFISLIYFI